jgi:PAS domain S-box-containing protein
MSESKHKTTSRRQARPTIAYLTTELYSHLGQWTGTVDAARKHDVNLITIPGASLHFPTGFDAQANILYELIDAETIDGLITWASAIGNFVTAEELQAFHERYRSLPMVTIGRTLEGIPSLLMDSYEGMREAIEHMIEVHGYRRLAFIRGPEDNLYAQERYRAYTEALEAHGITLDPKMVTPPAMWGRATGMEMMQLLLDERNLLPQADIDALVAANDSMAIAALDVLQARGIRVPTDMAIVGFDDRVEGRTITPPLTSVAAPFYDVGYRAVETLLALMAGEQIPEEVTVLSKLVVRQSCGCSNSAVMQAAADRVEVSKTELEAALVAQRTEIAAAMAQALETLDSSSSSGWAEQLLGGLTVELGGESAGAFLDALDEVLRQLPASSSELAAMQNAISILRRSMLPYLDGEALSLAENLWQQARVQIGEVMQRTEARERMQVEQRAQSLRVLGAALVATSDLEELLDVLGEGLPRVGIPSAYLSLYEDPQPYTYPQPAPEWSRLVLAHGEADKELSDDSSGSERFELAAGGRRFRSRQLVPEGLLPQGRRYSMVVQSLYYQQNQIGFVLLEIGPQGGVTPETLSTQISSALQGAHLLEDQRRAEETLTEERNLLRTLIDGMPDSVYVKDAESRFILANAEAARRTGVKTPDELVGKTDMDLYPDRLAAGYSADEQEIFRTGQPLINREEVVIDQTTGETIWNLTTKVPLLDDQGQVVGLVGLGRNITQRKETELALERRALQLQTAAEVSRAASSVLDLNVLIQQVVDLVQERFDLYYVGLFLVDELNRWAVLRAGTGEAGRQMIAQRHRLEVGGTSMIGDCVARKQPRVALDVGEEATRFDNPLLPDTRSELALPLVSRGEVIGALTIQSTQEAAFSDEDIAVFQIMADQLANAITNARLFIQTQAALAEMERIQRQYLERAWGEFARAQGVVGYEQTPEGIVSTGVEMLPGVEQALEDLSSVVMDGEDGTSVLTVPILLRGQPLGALGIRFDKEARELSPADIALVEGIGEQFALAAENLRLLDETQRRAARERLTSEVASRFRESLDLERVLQVATEDIYQALGLERVMVRLDMSDGVSREGSTTGSGDMGASQEEAA